MKFSQKLTLLLLSLIIVSGGIISFLVYSSNIKTLEDEIINNYGLMAHLTLQDVQQLLFERYADIQIIARDDLLSNKDSSAKDITKQLSEYRNIYKSYVGICFFDVNRIKVVDTSGLGIGKIYSYPYEWNAVLDAKRPSMFLLKSEFPGMNAICFASAVRNKNGKPIGIVVSKMPISKIHHILKITYKTYLHEKIKIDLLNENGLILYSNYNRKGILKDIFSEWDHNKNILNKKNLENRKHLYLGKEMLSVHAQAKDILGFKGLNWTLLSHMPVEIAFAPAVTLRNQIYFILMGACLFAICLSWLFSYTISKPLSLLRESAVQVMDGNLNVKSGIKSRDEFGKVGLAFDKMIVSLKERNEEIKRSNEKLQVEITEKKKTQEKLDKKQNFLDSIVQNIPNMIFVKDAKDLKFTMFNKAGEDILQIKTEMLIGKNDYDFFPKEQADFFTEKDRKVLKEGKMIDIYQEEIDTAHGKKILHTKKVPIFDKQGKPQYLLGISEDITEKLLMEQELFKEKRMESIGLLAGGIAHDFNNLLTVLYGNIKMIKIFYAKDKEVIKYLNVIEGSLQDARSLTDQLLTFSRGGEPVKQVVDLADLLIDIIDFSLRGSQTKAKYEISEKLWKSESDIGQIKQVISNLIINASQAMPQSGTIYIHAANVIFNENQSQLFGLDPGKYVKVLIQDKGVGMSKETLSQIFTPFFSTKEKGRGLGLSICLSIMKRHKGSIIAESEIDKGTTFTLYFPATEKELPFSKDKEKKSELELKQKILIMDDEKEIVAILSDFLQRIGSEVEITLNGEEAIEKYKNAKEAGQGFTLVLLDLTISGGMGGKETMEELKKIDPEVNAFVMSGYSKDPVLSNFKEYGFKGYILKPFDLEKVVKLIGKA
ncbi:MAG: response regulator [Candidatus Aureabacteria bacterium]|nr:response regulator [Candidatus Auribacterota bacterium]